MLTSYGSDTIVYDKSGNPTSYLGDALTWTGNQRTQQVHGSTISYSYNESGLITKKNLSCGIGTLNPFRYRSYIYDTETGLYYLKTMYYDPEVGRFINADVLMPTGQGVLGCSIFCYCLNNPVNMMYNDELE